MEREYLCIFDKEMESISDDYRFGNRFLFWGARIFTILFALFPMQEIAEGSRMLAFILVYFGGATAVTFMNSYTRMKEGDHTVSIYQKLQYLPISRREYNRSRYRYLWRTTCKTVIICVAMQLLMCMMAKEYHFGIWNLAYIVGLTGVIPWILAALRLRSTKN